MKQQSASAVEQKEAVQVSVFYKHKPLLKYIYMICSVVAFILAMSLLLTNIKLGPSQIIVINPEVVPTSPPATTERPQSNSKSTEPPPTTTISTTTTQRDLSGYGQECKEYYQPCYIEHCVVYYFGSNSVCTILCSDKHGDDSAYISKIIDDLLEISDCEEYKLYFSNCSIPLHRNWLRARGRLQLLEFMDSRLETIEEDAFNSAAFESLDELKFSSGSLVCTLQENFFTGLANLRSLYIHSPKFDLDQMPREVFRKLTSLRSLEMTLKRDQKMDLNRVIGSYENVKYLELSYNWIETIPSGVLERLPILAELSMVNCKVAKIVPGAFNGLSMLLGIDLGKNLLTTIPGGVLDEIAQRNGAKIFLNLNRFICDCNLKELQSLLKSERTRIAFHQPESYECQSPGLFVVNQELCLIESEKHSE